MGPSGNFEDGKVYYHYDSFLGYRKGEKIYVWRGLNRMENGKRICKNSPAVKSNLAALEARYKELLDLVMADSAKYEDFEDEFRITNERIASLKSLQIKLELEQFSATDLDRRMEQISSAIEQMDASITEYDGIRTRQLISTIKVLDKETLQIRFKDGTEITKSIEK